jgi:hypothetical protein
LFSQLSTINYFTSLFIHRLKLPIDYLPGEEQQMYVTRCDKEELLTRIGLPLAISHRWDGT